MIALVAALSLALDTPAPDASASPAPVIWQGIALGESIDAVIARLGPPDSRRKAIMGTTVDEFRAYDGDATLSLTESDGTVAAVRLIAEDPSSLRQRIGDPFGVQLGDTADRLTELRGVPQRYDDEGGGLFTSYYGKQSDVRWAYGLRDDVVISIGVIMPYRIVRATGAVTSVPTPRPSNAPTPPPPDASDLDRAIKVTQDELDADPQFELDFVRKVSCGSGDAFTPTTEEIINAKHRNFSRIDAVCKSTLETRSFYFDITAVFGRSES